MGVNIKGGNSSVGLANVTTNYDLQVVTPTNPDNAGFANMSCQVDDGTVLGTSLVLPNETSDDYRLRVGQDQTLFNLSFEGSNQSSGHVQFNTSGHTIAQANGFVALNSATAINASNTAYMRTYRMFPLFGTYPTYAEMWIREVNADATFAISEWGFFHLATTTSIVAPTDGVYFRRLAGGGALRAIVNYNGTETPVDINTTNVPARDGTGSYTSTEVSHYLISVHNDVARFWINDVLVASIDCPANQPALASASEAPLSFRTYVPTGANSSTGKRLEIAWINVSQGDMNTNKPWGQVMVGTGQGSYQVQPGNASLTLPITSNYVVNTAPAVMTLSNTAIPAATYASLGGQYQFTVPANAVETDFIMFGWQNTAGTATLPGKTLYITGVRIGEAVVTTILSHYHYLQWGIGANASALTLATVSDTATTMAYRRVTLGGQGFLASAALGQTAPGFQVDFSSAPLICAPGNYVTIIMRDISNAATATGAIRGNVTLIGYFE